MKKGFTLTELLAVIAIIGIISLVAIPNIINVVDNIKKQNMIDDATKLISLAKMKVNESYAVRNFTDTSFCNSSNKTCTFSLSVLNIKGDIKTDPDSGSYASASYVRYSVTNGVVNYCVYLKGSKRRIGTSSSCVFEDQLDNKANVITE